MRTPRLLSVFPAGLVFLGAATLSAQTNEPDSVTMPQVHDTGFVSNTGASRTAVISFPVQVEGAAWLRLSFSDVTLAGSADRDNASTLRITSFDDGAQQVMNAKNVVEWGNTSAYFNGGAVLVEVLSSPGAGASRVRLESVTAGMLPAPYRSQCGPNDDRQLSSDNRACRILPVGCTAWVIDDANSCMLTAGHCTGSVTVAQFNVPLSSSGGGIRNPPPQDQYPVDSSSLQTNGGAGVGNDYAYFGVFPNSNTGLTPFQAQGSAFNLTAPPTFNSNHNIRITGYGTDSGATNQIQQTHAGPWFSHNGNVMRYRADTTGGNSGSPVIHEPTGNAIGVHTHGGCGSSSGSSNAGTGFNHPNWQAAVQNPKGVCIKLTCGVTPTVLVRNGSGVNPVALGSLTLPAIGTNWMCDVDTSSVAGADLTVVQVRQAASPGAPSGFGEFLIEFSSPLLATSAALQSGGTAVHSFPIPGSVAIAGHTVYAQAGIQATGIFQTLTNALDATIGCAP